MKKQGWDRYYLPQAEVIHVFGSSVGKTSTPMRQYHLESQFKYFRKHFPAPAMAVFAAGYFVRSSISLLSWRLSCIVGARSGEPSPDIQFWQQARRLSAAEFRNLLSVRAAGQSQTTAASTAVRTT
jgi:GT2 family glycosyltransferase